MRPTAFIVGFLEKSTGTFKGADFFSEEHPTISFEYHPVTILAAHGRDYAEGLEQLEKALECDEWAWLRPHMVERAGMSW